MSAFLLSRKHREELKGKSYRTVQEDLSSEEGVVFAEISLVEDEQELDAVIQGLDGMGNATIEKSALCDMMREGLFDSRWEEPHIACG